MALTKLIVLAVLLSFCAICFGDDHYFYNVQGGGILPRLPYQDYDDRDEILKPVFYFPHDDFDVHGPYEQHVISYRSYIFLNYPRDNSSVSIQLSAVLVLFAAVINFL